MNLAEWFEERDSSLLHGLFAGREVLAAVLSSLKEEHCLNRRPPYAWREKWQAIPRLYRYTNILVFESGVHVLCVSLDASQPHLLDQFTTIEFGTVAVDELALPSELQLIASRARARRVAAVKDARVSLFSPAPPFEVRS